MYNEDCYAYHCGDCKNFGTYPNYCTRRIDHKKIEFAAPWFRCDPEAGGMICCEFEPKGIFVYDLKNYWTNYENWQTDWYDTQYDYLTEEQREEKKDNSIVWFTLNGNTNIRYGVRAKDYIYNTMYDGNKLKAVKKIYYKKTKEGFGYKLMREDIDGVEIE